MGSFVSLLLAPLVQLFTALVSQQPQLEEEPRSLSELLDLLAEQPQDNTSVLLARICRRLHFYPEEAACYCHTIDPSPLQQLLTNTHPSISTPVAVVSAFLEAYEDAALTSDQHGVTALLAGAKRSSVLVEAVQEGEASEEEEGPSIVQRLLQVNSQAAQQSDKCGRLPLHYMRSNVETTKQLLEAYPSAVEQPDKEGRLPLHYYCELEQQQDDNDDEDDDSRIATPLKLVHPEIARLLLQKPPSATLSPALQKDQKGITPLDLLYQSLQSVLLQEEKASSSHNTAKLETLWEVLTLLVQSTTTTTTFPLVHALVSLHCPALILKEALRRFPQQAVERDAQGRTPLLLAVSLLDNSNNNNDNNHAAVICQLLQTNPRAARMTDNEGRLAIDLLSEKQLSYNEQLYDVMVRAEPRAIDTRDLKNKQHPFLTAAMAGNSDGVYHLLRAKPHVIRHFLK